MSNIMDTRNALDAQIPSDRLDIFPGDPRWPNDSEPGYDDPQGADTTDNFRGLEDSDGNVVTIDFPESLWIEPKEWREVAAYNDEKRIWAQDTRADIGRFLNQSPTSMCTTFAKVYNAENAYRRQLGQDIRHGRKGNICLAPNSLYGISNTSGRGGANCLNITAIAIKYGFQPSTARNQAQVFGDNAMADCHGNGGVETTTARFVNYRSFPDGWEEMGQLLRPTCVINPDSVEQVICLLLHGLVVDVGRSGHAIGYDKVYWDSSNRQDTPSGCLYTDSYDVVRADSIRTARGCVGTSTSILRMSDPPKIWRDWFYAK